MVANRRTAGTQRLSRSAIGRKVRCIMPARPRFALVPLRRGTQLKTSSSDGKISLFHGEDTDGEIIFGRQQVLCCLYSACGCDPSSEVFKKISSKNKCGDCTRISCWARALSRKAISIRHGRHVYARGTKAIFTFTHSDGRTHTFDVGNEWSGAVTLEMGAKICFEPLRGPGSLEFEVVDGDEERGSLLMDGSSSEADHVDGEGGKKMPIENGVHMIRHGYHRQRNEGKPPQIDSLRENQTISSSVSKERKNLAKAAAKSSEAPNIVLYMCSFGQDLCRRRRQILENSAKTKGAIVVDFFHSATYIVVSENANSTFKNIASHLGVTEAHLENHLDTVSLHSQPPLVRVGL